MLTVKLVNDFVYHSGFTKMRCTNLLLTYLLTHSTAVGVWKSTPEKWFLWSQKMKFYARENRHPYLCYITVINTSRLQFTIITQMQTRCIPEVLCDNTDCMQSISVLLVQDKFCVVTSSLRKTLGLSLLYKGNITSADYMCETVITQTVIQSVNQPTNKWV